MESRATSHERGVLRGEINVTGGNEVRNVRWQMTRGRRRFFNFHAGNRERSSFRPCVKSSASASTVRECTLYAIIIPSNRNRSLLAERYSQNSDIHAWMSHPRMPLIAATPRKPLLPNAPSSPLPPPLPRRRKECKFVKRQESRMQSASVPRKRGRSLFRKCSRRTFPFALTLLRALRGTSSPSLRGK